YEKSWPGVWEYATVRDVGKAAKDWPQINFVMYHAALRPFLETPDAALNELEQTGRIKWATDLAEIPTKLGVKNVYAEVGTAFALRGGATARSAGGWGGAPVRGPGAHLALGGTVCLGYAPRRGKIGALGRREIPEKMQRKRGFPPPGPADGLVKNAIFGTN